MTASAIIRAAPFEPARPWPRHVLTQGAWREMLGGLGDMALLALWAETGQVHALFLDGGTPLLATTSVIAGSYPALSPQRPGAILFERMIADLWGHAAEGGIDARPWLDHGRWGVVHPMALRPAPRGGTPEPPDFLPPCFLPGDRPGVHQIPVGPIQPGIAEPAHARFHALGEAVLRLEMRLGYAHKGVLTMMRGKSPRAAARFAARLSGDATVANGIAFARAAEAALEIEAPPRARVLRSVMAELERMANHLGDIGAVCDGAGLARAGARFAGQREHLLQAADAAFGHRLMMDAVVPGGVAADIADPGVLATALDEVAAALPALARLYESSLSDRLAGAGVVSAAQADRFAASGFVGRAAGRRWDSRTLGAAPGMDVPSLTAGDADARLRIRLAEARESARLARDLLDGVPMGPLAVSVPVATGEGLGVAESFRGDTWCWLRLDGGLIASAFAADPSWRQWPLLEAAIGGSDMADVPLIARSFNCAVSGVDL